MVQSIASRPKSITIGKCTCIRRTEKQLEEIIYSVEQWARLLGEHIQETFNDATKQSDITAVSVALCFSYLLYPVLRRH